jgi:hypothetical protein
MKTNQKERNERKRENRKRIQIEKLSRVRR